jgi:ParB-like chromosome segregation protein Spo0J
MKEQIIERIPIAEIHIANPRPRSRGRWLMIVANIREVGLKKPITVVRRSEPSADGKQFELVCGQGRIEAFLSLGETTIPAIIAEASREDQFLMSLVENIARRPHPIGTFSARFAASASADTASRRLPERSEWSACTSPASFIWSNTKRSR